MFPLKTRQITGYKFGQPTFYSNFHLGTDYGKEGLEVYAPFDGLITFRGVGVEGGNTLWLKPQNLDVVMRFLHLSQFLVQQGQSVKEGQIIAITGNTGHSTAGHLHLDVSKHKVDINNTKNFIDPEKFDWVGKDTMVLVENNGTYYEEGEKGYLGIANMEYLNLKLKLTDKVEHRKPNGVQLGVVETAPQSFVIKNN